MSTVEYEYKWPSQHIRDRDDLKLIIRPLIATGGHARYPDGHRSSPEDVVVNIVHLEDNFASIAEELDAIRRRLDATQGFDEFPQRGSRTGR